MDDGGSAPLSNGDLPLNSELSGHVQVQTQESMKRRVLKTVALWLSFAGLGFSAPILGLSIVHMEYILNTNTHSLAFTFTCHSIGYTLGGIICGFVYDHLNKEFSFSVTTIMTSLMTIAAGFASHLYAFMALMMLQGMAMGFIDAAGQSYCVNIWLNHRFKEPMLQAAHALWSLAATIGPFIIRPFLAELPSKSSLGNTTNNTLESLNETELENVTSLVNLYTEEHMTELTEEQLAAIFVARYAYLAVGLVIFCTSILFVVLYLYDCSPIVIQKVPKKKNNNSSIKRTSTKQKGKFLLIMFIIMLFFFYFLYIYIEGIPLAYFTAFVIRHLGWSVQYGTLVMSVFFGTHFAGRLMGIPLSVFLKPRTMVLMNLLLTAIAYILLLFVNIWPWVMWISSFLSGYGMSSTFAAMILWISESIPITGRVAAVVLVGGSFGGMTGPLLVGVLFDTVSPMCLAYVLVAASIAHIILFAFLLFFVKKWKDMFSVYRNVNDREMTVLNEASAADVVAGEKDLNETSAADAAEGEIEQKN